MIPSPAVAAAISLPVSAVATGRRTAFEALYCRSVGLKLLVWTQTARLAVARFCRRIFSPARALWPAAPGPPPPVRPAAGHPPTKRSVRGGREHPVEPVRGGEGNPRRRRCPS